MEAATYSEVGESQNVSKVDGAILFLLLLLNPECFGHDVSPPPLGPEFSSKTLPSKSARFAFANKLS